MATYRDKNTGVCISTDSELAGDWIPIEEFKNEYLLTVSEIKSKLDELGVEYDSKANKSALLDLLIANEG
ncbi:HeH/LEM domain-containing protein [Streptococcus oralis subsp. tigurinus]|uniref:HeH/LEM domain-containing protein n=1 Tax=Streptococcus oralis TaxID=1303 RepID=UPI0039C3F630